MSKRNLQPAAAIAGLAIVACATEVTSGRRVQLFPAGPFRARDGRPTDAAEWVMDADIAATLIAAASARQNDYVADYEHQMLRAKENGKPAPAAGWFKDLEWVDGAGLFATDMRWTPAASAGIDNHEFRYISPVFSYAKGTGRVTGLFMAALTNDAGIDGMQDVLAAASTLFDLPSTTEKESDMEALLERLQWLLNLPVGATAEDILAQLDKLKEKLQAAAPEAAAAASFDLTGYLDAQGQKIVALSTTTPDPAKFVPMETFLATQQKLAALSTEVGAGKLDTIIEGALASGKLLPAQEAWARNLGAQNIAALSTFLDTAPSIPALGGLQSPGAVKPGENVVALTSAQKDFCRGMGVAEADFLKTLQESAQA